jgi:stearoyl-CoA desaturase (delta-9 desaturase)
VPVGVVIGLSSAVLTAVITEIYAHRCLAHRAFRVHPSLASFFETYFRVIVGTDPETWAAVHRLHHRYADTPLDPHSPVQRPPLAVLFGSPFLFAAARPRVPPGAPRGKSHIVIRLLITAFFLALVGVAQVLTMLVVHLVTYMGIMGLVNTVGHLYGRKPHPDSPGYDAAWLAIPLLGHGYHNSHHAHPAAARTGRLDPVWPLLRLLAALGLVRLEGRHSHRASLVCCTASASLSGAPAPGARRAFRLDPTTPIPMGWARTTWTRSRRTSASS